VYGHWPTDDVYQCDSNRKPVISLSDFNERVTGGTNLPLSTLPNKVYHITSFLYHGSHYYEYCNSLIVVVFMVIGIPLVLFQLKRIQKARYFNDIMHLPITCSMIHPSFMFITIE
jgi:hypothetical protein